MIILLFINIQILFASEVKYNPIFLQQTSSAELDGAGEGIAAYSIGALSLNNNPAGLSYAKNIDILINFRKLPSINGIIMKETGDGKWVDHSSYHIKSGEMGVINCAIPMGKFGNLGMGFVLSYSGNFIRVNEEGKAINSFPEGDIAFAIGYSRKFFDNASFGFDVRSIRSKIPIEEGVNIGKAYAMNAGFMHQIGTRVTVGAVLQNIGNDMSFSKPDEDISGELRRNLLVGARYMLKDKGKSLLLLNMDVNPPFKDGPRYNLGLEFAYLQLISLRLGYMRSTYEYYDELINLYDGTSVYENRVWKCQGITIGAGIKFGKAEISVSSAPFRQPTLENGEKLRLEDQKNILSMSFMARI